MSLDIQCCVKVDVGNPDVDRAYIGESFNYTHNVTDMWRKAGCYDALYNSDGKMVSEILPALRSGLANMQDNPSDYLPLNPKNGWGSYDTAIKFLGEVIAEFSRYPKALVYVSK